MTNDTPTIFKKIAANRNDAAVQAHHSGSKIVGYLSNNIPLEIIHASGAMALHLSGNVEQDPDLANDFMEAAFDPITRSVFDRLLKGEYDFLDLIVLPRCNDAQQRLYYYVREIQRKHSQYTLPPVYLVDLLHTPWPSSEKRNLTKLSEFKNTLEELFKCSISDQQLNASREIYNRTRTLLREFSQLRARTNSKVTSESAYAVYTGAQSMPVEDFNSALEALISDLKAADDSITRKPKLVLAGNALDHPALHQAIDAIGAVVVGDYHCLGSHFLPGQININDRSPLAAISEHYHRETLSSRTFSPEPQALIDFAKQQNADGIVFYFLQGEEALTWQVPKQKLCAEQAGLPVLCLYDQKYGLNKDTMNNTIRPFIQSCLSSNQSEQKGQR